MKEDENQRRMTMNREKTKKKTKKMRTTAMMTKQERVVVIHLSSFALLSLDLVSVAVVALLCLLAVSLCVARVARGMNQRGSLAP